MGDGSQFRSDGSPRNRHRHGRRGGAAAPPHRPEGGIIGKIVWAWRWFWFILLRNRLALAVASLLWLIYRSGTQPRRLSYPCQQVAAVNVGAIAAGLIPTLFLVRKRGLHALPRSVVVRRQLIAAGIMFAAALIGMEGYQFAQSLIPPRLPEVPARLGDPVPTTVGIAHRAPSGASYTADEIEAMVRRAVSSAGGLDDVIDTGDHIVLKPNLVQDFWDATQGVVTDPRVCYAIVKLAQEAGAGQITIAEGTAAGSDPYSRTVTWNAYVTAGYDTNGDHLFDYDPSVALFDLNDSGGLHVADPAKVTAVALPAGVAAIRQTPFEYYVPNILLDCDVLICVPTFKNHYHGMVTLALKNRVGCAPNDLYHGDESTWGVGVQGKLALVHYTDAGFGWNVPPEPADEVEIVQRTIVDLNLVRPQDFAVVDALIGITTGPNDKPLGHPDPYAQMIVAGRDSLAVDTACALAMGYDPDYVPHLAWADSTGQLGTKDRSVIAVAGDRVPNVRYDFPLDWPEGDPAVPANSSPPSLAGISVNEGHLVIADNTITGSGTDDDQGVVQAALFVDLLSFNLLTNGDFETGSGTGWTTWRADWGSNELWQFDNAEPGHKGQYCLKLGSTSTTSSFGVYQQVPVEPGKTYRLDLYWKGHRYGTWNWFEVLLLDGEFDPEQADTGEPPSDYVQPNYMYAYNSNTFALPGSSFGWIWGHEQYAPPRNQVDWNNRLGRRTASGNTMTVVLKAGADLSTPGVEAWFDEVSLVEVGAQHRLSSVPYPQDPFELTADMSELEVGEYPAELRVTVYDNALNEDSIYRNVTVNTAPPGPWVCVDQTYFEQTIFVGENPSDDGFDVWNCGPDTLDYSITWDAIWLQVNPYEETSTSGQPPNHHTISYNCGNLPPGLYTEEIFVSGPQNDRKITVKVDVETVICDFVPADGDVDMDDFGHLQVCFTGSGMTTIPEECLDADCDGDRDVDGHDLEILQECMSGANVIADKTCDDEYQ